MKTIEEQEKYLIDTITEKQKKLLKDSDCLYPDELSRIGMELAVLLSSLGVVEASREITCNMVMKLIMDNDPKMTKSKAEVMMKCQEEYESFRKVRAVRISLEEIIKMIKIRIRALQNEEQITKNI